MDHSPYRHHFVFKSDHFFLAERICVRVSTSYKRRYLSAFYSEERVRDTQVRPRFRSASRTQTTTCLTSVRESIPLESFSREDFPR